MPTFTQADDMAWPLWVATNASTTSSAGSVWVNWTSNTATSATGSWRQVGGTPLRPPPETQEQQQARVERELAEQRRIAERALEVAAEERSARERASETLRMLLDETQWADWEREQRFELITQAGRRYRVRRGISGNVRLVEGEGDAAVETESLCCHPRTALYDEEGRRAGTLPVEDVVIAQVLALRADEDGFRRTANVTPISAARRRAGLGAALAA